MQQRLYEKGQIVIILGYVGPVGLVANTHLCLYSMTAAIDNTWKDEYGRVSIKQWTPKF